MLSVILAIDVVLILFLAFAISWKLVLEKHAHRSVQRRLGFVAMGLALSVAGLVAGTFVLWPPQIWSMF